MIPAAPPDRHELRGGRLRGALLVWRAVRAASRPAPTLTPSLSKLWPPTLWLSTRILSAALLALPLLLGACTSVTMATIPEPLPESLPWIVPLSGGAFLGLSVEENDSGSLDNLYFEPGVRVIGVAPSSPAAAAGVQLGDVLLQLDGHEVSDPAALESLLASRKGGEACELQVQRADTAFALSVTLAEQTGPRTPPRELWRRDRTRSLAGWSTAADGAVLVCAAPGSPVIEAGLPLGAVVQAVDGRETLSDRALIRALEAKAPGSSAELLWHPPGETRPRVAHVELPDEPRVITEFFVPLIVDYEASADRRKSSFELFDLWFLVLFRHLREDGEHRWVLLRLFGFDVFSFSSGVGELSS
jgi:hypothetical protein